MKTAIPFTLAALALSTLLQAETTPDVKALVDSLKNASSEERIALMNQYKSQLSAMTPQERQSMAAEFKAAAHSAGIGQELKLQVQARNQQRIQEGEKHQEEGVHTATQTRTKTMDATHETAQQTRKQYRNQTQTQMSEKAQTLRLQQRAQQGAQQANRSQMQQNVQQNRELRRKQMEQYKKDNPDFAKNHPLRR